jgi:hypothetical protein
MVVLDQSWCIRMGSDNQDIRGKYRKFDGKMNADFIKMRVIAIREAQETMERGVSERDNPSTFPA